MNELPQQLQAALSLPDPAPWRRAAREAQRPLEPELAYGRHQGPPPSSAKQAAVVLLLYPGAGDWMIPLTRRSERLPDHPGQVSLPGGILEPGEDAVRGGMREWEEEMGCSSAPLRLLGRLPAVYVFATNYWVTPLVAAATSRPSIQPNAAEVSRVIELPARRLCDPPATARDWAQRGQLRFETPYWECDGERIWGATLQMLSELGTLIRFARS